jgi:DNA-binding MarR family transcriptional regulator
VSPDEMVDALEQAGLDGYAIPREVMERGDLTPGARLAYAVLRRAETVGIYLRVADLAEALDSNTHSAQRWIEQLREEGLIDRPRRNEGRAA